MKKLLSIVLCFISAVVAGQGLPVRISDSGFPVKIVNKAEISQENFTTNLQTKLDAGVSIATGNAWVALGTSITNGSTAGAGQPYTAKLAHIIGTGIVSQVIAKGYPGERSDQILAHYDTDIHPLKIGGVFL